MNLIDFIESKLTKRTVFVVHNDVEAAEAYRRFGRLIAQNSDNWYSMQENFETRVNNRIYPFTIIVEGLTTRNIGLICGENYGDN